MMETPSRPGFNEPDFRTMSLHILNTIVPMVFTLMLIGAVAAADDRAAFTWPILILYALNLTLSALQRRGRFRYLTWLTVSRFIVSFPLVCWLAWLSRGTSYAWIYYLPQCFALSFSFLMPRRAVALLIWNSAALAFLWSLAEKPPLAFSVVSFILVSLASAAGAWLLERNLRLIRKLPEEDREKWGITIGNQAVISYLVLIAGIGVTLLLVRNELDHRRQTSLSRFNAQAQTGIRNLNLRLESQRSALESMSAFFEGNLGARKAEFDRFAERLIPVHPYISALEWVPRVTRKERTAFEASVRAETGEEYRILRPDAGAFRPAPDRAEYFPIRYIYPMETNRRIWGLDVAFTPDRKACVEQAMTRLSYTVCQPLRLVRDTAKQWTAVACMPVPSRNPIGIVVSLIELDRMVQDIIVETLPKSFAVDLDFQSGKEWTPIVKAGPRKDAVPLEDFSDTIGGTPFRVRISVLSGAVGGQLQALDILMLSMGIASSLVLAYFLFHARKSNLPLEIKVQERTRELQSVVMRAEEASQAKSRFLAQMSHEIRTPMNGVLGMSEALLHSEIDKDSRESVELIKASGLHLLTILNDILDISKIESGKMELDVRPFHLGRLLSEIVGVMKYDADSQGVSLELKPATPLPEWVTGDPLRVRQILMNLLSNALKFTPKGSVTVTVGFAHPGRFQAHIVDSGIGISEEKLDRLFQPFEQGDTSTTRKFGGTGLGLAISLQFAKMMGGDIRVRSKENVGTDICLTLDLQATTALVQSGKEPSARLRRGGRLLLAEDNIVNVRVAKALLEDYFESIDVAANGREALDMMGAYPYEMILMDLQMPEMDGLQATREIRKRHEWNRIPIIALTANAFSSDRRDCLAAGMQDFLVKPITKAGLHRVLSPYLREFD